MTAKGIWNVVVSSPKVISNINAGGRGGRREGGSFGLWVGGYEGDVLVTWVRVTR